MIYLNGLQQKGALLQEGKKRQYLMKVLDGLNKNKVRWLVLIIAILTIITFAVIRVNQIYINHQANLSKSEECIKDGGKVVIEEGFLSLTSVYCEK